MGSLLKPLLKKVIPVVDSRILCKKRFCNLKRKPCFLVLVELLKKERWWHDLRPRPSTKIEHSLRA